MRNSFVIKKEKGTTTYLNPSEKENLAKKRPSTTKLDLEKMFEESIELTAEYKKLQKQHAALTQQYQKVENAKLNRQNLISTVQKIVKEKAKDLNGKVQNHSSWLVFKLNSKIYDLKAKIEQKENLTKQLQLSKQCEKIREKQIQAQCLDQILNFAKDQHLEENINFNDRGKQQDQNKMKEIIWMQEEIKQKEQQIIKSQNVYKKEEKEVKRLMKQLAKKKAELKSVKQMEEEYNKTQQLFKEEKKKKEQKMAGNKSHLEELQNKKQEEIRKLDDLRTKFALIEIQENAAVEKLQNELDQLRKDVQIKHRVRAETITKSLEDKAPSSKKRKVKRVTFNQVEKIAKNLNYMLSLRNISLDDVSQCFSEEDSDHYTIKEVCSKLQNYPFCLANQEQRLLLARYAIEDNGDGYFLEDMETSESSCIIKSVLCKIIGKITVYTSEEIKELTSRIGDLLAKYGKLVQQNLDSKQNTIKKLTTKQKMVEALQSTHLILSHADIQFIIFYLFSWSRNIDKLEVEALLKMHERPVNWDQAK